MTIHDPPPTIDQQEQRQEQAAYLVLLQNTLIQTILDSEVADILHCWHGHHFHDFN